MSGEADSRAVLERLLSALDRLDLEAFVACFHEDFVSEQPLHPELGFTGSSRIRENWQHKLKPGSDFTAELLDSTIDGDTIWTEWRWTGTRPDGTARDERGVILYFVRQDRVARSRLYVDQAES